MERAWVIMEKFSVTYVESGLLTIFNQFRNNHARYLTGDFEARAKLGLPEEVWGNLATMRQGYDQSMPAGAVSKSVASQLSPQLNAYQRRLGRAIS